VLELLVNTGDFIQTGQMIAKLDDELVRSQLALAGPAFLPELWTALSFACVLFLSFLGPIVSLALFPQALLLYRCNRGYLLRTKQD